MESGGGSQHLEKGALRQARRAHRPAQPAQRQVQRALRQAQRAQFRQYLHQSFERSMRDVGLVVVAMFVLLAVEDWFSHNDRFRLLLTGKIVVVGILVVSWLLARSQWGRPHGEKLLLGGSYAIFVQAFYQAVLVEDVVVVVITAVFGLVISATVLRWPAAYHLAFVIGAVMALLAAILFPGANGRLPYGSEVVGGLLVAAVSLYLFHNVYEERFALWKAQSELRESEERFRQLGEYSKDIIWIWTPDRKVQYVSPSYERFSGRSPENLYRNGLLVLNIVHKDDQALFGEALEDVFRGEFRLIEWRVHHRDGRIFHLEGWGAPIRNEQGEVVRCVGIWRDVTERVRLVEDLDAYAHAVAHDLKSPVALINGYSDLLELAIQRKDFKGAGELVNRILNGCDTMTEIIDELLLLASVRRLDEVVVDRLDMAGIVGQVLERLEGVIGETKAVVQVPESWPAARGYWPWVAEVWTNYLSNGIKYGGRPPQLILGAEEMDGVVCFWVCDNGAGLDVGGQARLFQEFSQLEPGKNGGHGLGLSIVKRIVEKLGGEVGVESALGKGSKFWFTLPGAS